jgi:hypothetical protein
MMRLNRTQVLLLYTLYDLTRKKPTATAPFIGKYFLVSKSKRSARFHTVKQLHILEVAELVLHITDKNGFYHWSLTLLGHNTLKAIERMIRKQENVSKISSRSSVLTQLFSSQNK